MQPVSNENGTGPAVSVTKVATSEAAETPAANASAVGPSVSTAADPPVNRPQIQRPTIPSPQKQPGGLPPPNLMSPLRPGLPRPPVTASSPIRPTGAPPPRPAAHAAPQTQQSGPKQSPVKHRATRGPQRAPTAQSQKKHCNCKNSRCLKLYCECFASGRYCDGCNCATCYNNHENETIRQAAVEGILERNPNAFRPKIQAGMDNTDAAVARHNKGCNCKKSFCLKKYCECFQAAIFCSQNCKCIDCKNYEGSDARDTLMFTQDPARGAGLLSPTKRFRVMQPNSTSPLGLPVGGMSSPQHMGVQHPMLGGFSPPMRPQRFPRLPPPPPPLPPGTLAFRNQYGEALRRGVAEEVCRLLLIVAQEEGAKAAERIAHQRISSGVAPLNPSTTQAPPSVPVGARPGARAPVPAPRVALQPPLGHVPGFTRPAGPTLASISAPISARIAAISAVVASAGDTASRAPNGRVVTAIPTAVPYSSQASAAARDSPGAFAFLGIPATAAVTATASSTATVAGTPVMAPLVAPLPIGSSTPSTVPRPPLPINQSGATLPQLPLPLPLPLPRMAANGVPISQPAQQSASLLYAAQERAVLQEFRVILTKITTQVQARAKAQTTAAFFAVPSSAAGGGAPSAADPTASAAWKGPPTTVGLPHPPAAFNGPPLLRPPIVPIPLTSVPQQPPPPPPQQQRNQQQQQQKQQQQQQQTQQQTQQQPQPHPQPQQQGRNPRILASSRMPQNLRPQLQGPSPMVISPPGLAGGQAAAERPTGGGAPAVVQGGLAGAQGVAKPQVEVISGPPAVTFKAEPNEGH